MDLHPDVVSFIEKQIHSVTQLDVLLLLRERTIEWTPSAVARELRISDSSAELCLRDLSLRRMIDETSGGFRYAPATSELAASIDALAAAYRDMKYSVINVIFSVPGDSARAFADAFRIRKPKEGD